MLMKIYNVIVKTEVNLIINSNLHIIKGWKYSIKLMQ